MTAAVVTVTVPLRFTAEVRGRRAFEVLRRADVPRLFDHKPASGGSSCWTCPATRVSDLVAAASTLRSVRVVVEHEQVTLL